MHATSELAMIGHLLKPELEELISEKKCRSVAKAVHFHPSTSPKYSSKFRIPIFRILPRELAGEVFAHLPPHHQEALLRSLTNEQMRSLLNEMTPDDQTRVLEESPPEVTRRLLAALSPAELKEARDLLGYPPETAGRYMTPEYVDIRANMTAEDALAHVRKTGRDKETVNVLYVLDERQVGRRPTARIACHGRIRIRKWARFMKGQQSL